MSLGRGTAAAQELANIVDRVEWLAAQRKQISEDISAVMSEGKAKGFNLKGIRNVIRKRAQKPHDRQEEESILDLYLHALGMESETPLHRHVEAMTVDTAAREEVIEALKAFVPDNGSITVEAGGKPVQLTRDADGKVSVHDVVERPKEERGSNRTPGAKEPAPLREPPPDCSEDDAELLGRAAFKDNVAITKNPFPFGDKRRPRWDLGWRLESGSDGMGPDRKGP